MENSNAATRLRSGEVNCTRLEAVLYTLMRDDVPCGRLQQIVQDMKQSTDFEMSNGWLAEYAKDLAKQIAEPPQRHTMPQWVKNISSRFGE
ncbi:MAG: hypothetical protein V3R83_09770 [Gammaproteobacteria bacterium]